MAHRLGDMQLLTLRVVWSKKGLCSGARWWCKAAWLLSCMIHWTLDGAKVSAVGKTQDGGHGKLQGRKSLPGYVGKGLEERELEYVTRRYEKRHVGGHLGWVRCEDF